MEDLNNIVEAIMFALGREISVDEKYAIQAKCPKCGIPIETEISISGLVKLPTKTGKIKNLGRLPNDEEDFLNKVYIIKGRKE